jgi:hypothetical protein
LNGQSGGFSSQKKAPASCGRREGGEETMITTDCEARFAIHASIDAAAAHVLRMAD